MFAVLKRGIKRSIKRFLSLPSVHYVCNGVFHRIEKISFYAIERYRFKQWTGYKIQFANPRSFNEKVTYKKIYDRNPILPTISDKYKVRDYVREKLGPELGESVLIPCQYITDKPSTIPFSDLIKPYIIKANHASGLNRIVYEDSQVDESQIIRDCKLWLATHYGSFKHEWAYQSIERKIIIENLLVSDKGAVPEDYKFHMMNGECVFLQVDLDRFGSLKRSLYDKHWNRIEGTLKYPSAGHLKKPPTFHQMLKIAEKLSSDFDYIRVDLYELNGKIYFGELTSYPGSGAVELRPLNLDFALGDKWIVDTENYTHYLKNS